MDTRFVNPFFWNTSDGAALANDVTETALFVTRIIDTSEIGREGKQFRIKAWFKYSTTSAPTMIFALRYGSASGTLLCKTDAIVMASGITNAIACVEFLVTVRTIGATGTIYATCVAVVGSGIAPTVGSATGAAAVALGGIAGGITPAVATVDLTASLPFTVTGKWSAASASNTITFINGGGDIPN